MQRKQRERRFFGGPSRNRAALPGATTLFGQRYNPKKPLLPPLPLHFKVLGFGPKAAGGVYASRFGPGTASPPAPLLHLPGGRPGTVCRSAGFPDRSRRG